MPSKKAPDAPAPEVTKVELLTVEAHPTLGRLERWRMSDGSVKDIWFTPTFVERV